MSRSGSLRFKPVVDTGSFARYVPFSDERELIVRRGRALGQDYGLPVGERTIVVNGQTWVLIRYRQLLSPPPLRPGETPMSAEQARSYAPESEVLRTSALEVMIRREPGGFDDAEVEAIIANVARLEASQGVTEKARADSNKEKLFAVHSDPRTEVRRCARCSEPAMVCLQRVHHSVSGVAAGWVNRKYVCQRCGAKVTLVDPKRIRALQLTAWIMIWSVVATPILLLIAALRKRAWARHPLVNAE